MWRAEPDGPQGPMQATPAAASDVGGGDRFDGQENRALGRAYLAHMYRRYGTWLDAVAAYNWGPGHMDAWISGGRPFDKLPPAVERYRIRVLYGSPLGALRLGNVHLQPRRPAADPHNGRGAVELLYPEIMRASHEHGKDKRGIQAASNHLILPSSQRRIIPTEMTANRLPIDDRPKRAAEVAHMIAAVALLDDKMVAR